MPKWWKKKRREVPADAVCHNCNTQLLGEYCHICGQSAFAGQGQSIFRIIGDMFDGIFSIDGKIPRTIIHLLFKPGFLSAEYRAGRVVRYVLPVKLFWISTILFFALSFSQCSFETNSNQGQEQMATANVMTVGGNDLDDLVKAYRVYIPYITFFFIPVFALLLQLFFYRKKYLYIYHLTFAAHFHSFLWILWSLLIIFNILFSDWSFPGWLGTIIFFLPGIYLAFAIYCFYQPERKRSAVWKSIVIMLLYTLLILTCLIAAIFLLWNNFYNGS